VSLSLVLRVLLLVGGDSCSCSCSCSCSERLGVGFDIGIDIGIDVAIDVAIGIDDDIGIIDLSFRVAVADSKTSCVVAVATAVAVATMGEGGSYTTFKWQELKVSAAIIVYTTRVENGKNGDDPGMMMGWNGMEWNG